MSGGQARPRRLESAGRVGVIVLGMHRSGTSALTRVLSLLGCDLPKTLLGTHKSNVTGHWESKVICRLNERILGSAGSSWSDWVEFDPGWHQSPKADQFQKEARVALETEFGTSRLFVLKDPRLCRTTRFWIDILSEASIQPLVFFIVRNPLEVANSLQQRNGFDPSLGHLLWLRNVLDAEFASRGATRFFASYDQLIKNWARLAEHAQSALGIIWPRLPAASGEIESFLSDRYRHHKEPSERVFEDLTLSRWLGRSFAILERWTRTGENPEDFAALDQIRLEFNTAASAFARVMKAEQDAVEKARELEVDLAETRAMAGRFKRAVAVGRRRTAAAQEELARLDRARDEQARKAKATQAELSKTRRLLKREVARLTRCAAASKGEAERAMAEAERAMAEAKAAAQRASASEKRVRDVRRTAARELGRAVSGLLGKGGWAFMPDRLRVHRKIAVLRRSGLLDAEWYVSRYKDVAASGVDPLRHYVQHGAREGREPNSALAEERCHQAAPQSSDAHRPAPSHGRRCAHPPGNRS